MKKRIFIDLGGMTSEITEQSNAAFIIQYQIAILSSLLERGLINRSQYDRCVEIVGRQGARKSPHS